MADAKDGASYAVQKILDNLKDTVTCLQCSEVINDPVLTICLHSFCGSCLQQLWIRHPKRFVFLCPICETEATLPLEDEEEILESPTNFHLSRALDIYKAKHFEETMAVCFNCNKTSTYEAFCFGCDHFLCSTCIDAHSLMSTNNKHRTVRLEDFQNADYEALYKRDLYCNHERKDREKAEFYCLDCGNFMCGLCDIAEDDNHETQDIRDIALRTKLRIDEWAPMVRGKSRDIETGIQNVDHALAEVDERIDSLRNEIKAKVASLVQILQNHGQEMLEELEDVRTEKKEKLLSQRRKLQVLLTQTTSSVEFAESLIERKFAAEMVMVRDHVTSRLEEMGSLIVDTRPVESATVEYIPNGSLVRILESNFLGHVFISDTDPLSSFAEGTGVRHAFVGEETVFTVTTRDIKGEVCFSRADRIAVQLMSQDGELIELQVKSLENGFYEMMYIPKLAGSHTLSIRVSGKHIQESPFEVLVMPPVMQPFKSFGSIKGARGLFTQPHGLAVSSNGNIAVSDTHKHCIHLLNLDGMSVTELGGDDIGSRDLSYPTGLAFDKSGKNIIVADRDNHRLSIYSTKTGKLLKHIGCQGKSEGQFDGPSGVFVDGEGRIVVSDWNNHRIQVLSGEGKFLFKFGDTSQNKLKHPRDAIFCDRKRCFVVSDTGHHVLKIFDQNGRYLYNIGRPGSRKGELYSPRGTTVDALDRIVVCDFDNHRIQFFRFDGTSLNSFGTKGDSLGQFNYPMGVTLSNNNHIIVSDWGNDRIQVFTIGLQWKGPLFTENNNYSF